VEDDIAALRQNRRSSTRLHAILIEWNAALPDSWSSARNGGVFEITYGDRIREPREIAQYPRDNRSHAGVMPVAAPSRQRARVDQTQACEAVQEQSLAGTGQSAFAFPRQPLEMLDQLIELKEERTWVGVVQQDQVVNCGDIRHQIIPASVSQCAIGNFEHRFQYA